MCEALGSILGTIKHKISPPQRFENVNKTEQQSQCAWVWCGQCSRAVRTDSIEYFLPSTVYAALTGSGAASSLTEGLWDYSFPYTCFGDPNSGSQVCLLSVSSAPEVQDVTIPEAQFQLSM